MKVTDQVSRKCKEAFLAGTPLIWIQTDSFEIVRDIVERDEMVVRLAPSLAGERFEGRPYRELPEDKKRGCRPQNHKDQNLEDIAPKDGKEDRLPANAAAWTCPQIITYHVGEKGIPEKSLERYVKEYLDPLSPVHELFRSCAVILYGSAVRLPQSLLSYTEIIPVPLPEQEEIGELVQELIAQSGLELPDNEDRGYLADLSAAFAGFSEIEIRRTMSHILMGRADDGRSPLDDPKTVFKVIQEQKKQRILSSEVLKLISAPSREDEKENSAALFQGVGGLKNLKDWVRERKDALRHADKVRRTSGAESPKGILVCGIPGCGKSLAAKAVAKAFSLPLLQMDMGSLMDKYQGESEKNMRRAQELAEAMSPCVLWIDELEKGFSGAGSDSGNDASFKRMFGTMLNWMQENQKPVFLYATANDIGGLPKEFFRSGRFDALFAAYLPTCEECAEILLASMDTAAANARDVPELFTAECRDKEWLAELIDETMAAGGRARVMIGADISKLTNQALIVLSGKKNFAPISREIWGDALRAVMKSGSVYGDGAENLDSIAVSYIRMLKKGFIPANERPMFTQADYRPDGPEGHYIKRLDEEKLPAVWRHAYDRAVYTELADRMDDLAAPLEQRELNRLLGF